MEKSSLARLTVCSGEFAFAPWFTVNLKHSLVRRSNVSKGSDLIIIKGRGKEEGKGKSEKRIIWPLRLKRKKLLSLFLTRYLRTQFASLSVSFEVEIEMGHLFHTLPCS